MAVILTVLKQFMMKRRIIVNGQEKGTSMSNCVVLENALTFESLEGQVTRTLINFYLCESKPSNKHFRKTINSILLLSGFFCHLRYIIT
jgi:hypothetical protein